MKEDTTVGWDGLISRVCAASRAETHLTAAISVDAGRIASSGSGGTSIAAERAPHSSGSSNSSEVDYILQHLMHEPRLQPSVRHLQPSP